MSLSLSTVHNFALPTVQMGQGPIAFTNCAFIRNNLGTYLYYEKILVMNLEQFYFSSPLPPPPPPPPPKSKIVRMSKFGSHPIINSSSHRYIGCNRCGYAFLVNTKYGLKLVREQRMSPSYFLQNEHVTNRLTSPLEGSGVLTL